MIAMIARISDAIVMTETHRLLHFVGSGLVKRNNENASALT